MRKYFITLFLFLFSILPLFGSLDKGEYMLRFQIEDMGFEQLINISSTDLERKGIEFVDIAIKVRGSLNYGQVTGQEVRGIIKNQILEFVLPIADLDKIETLKFKGRVSGNKNEVIGEGSTDLYDGRTFKFRITKE